MKKPLTIKIFTHNDMDGAASALAIKAAFPDSLLDITICNYNNLDERIIDFCKSNSIKDYDAIFFTDLSIKSKETADWIRKIAYKHAGVNIKVIDHHKDSEHLNSDIYKFFTYVHTDNKRSGAKLVMDYLSNAYKINFDKIVVDYINHVSNYDTWAWDKQEDKFPETLNVAFKLNTGSGLDEESIINYVFYQYELLTKNKTFIDDKLFPRIVDYTQTREEWFKHKNSRLRKYKDKSGRVYGLVLIDGFTADYTSVVGNKFCKVNPDLDYVVLLNVEGNTMSFRTSKDNIEVNKIANMYGGGGHEKSAGGKQPMQKNIYDYIASHML